MKIKLLTWAATLLLAPLTIPTACADTFMVIPGIPGESTVDKFNGAIEVTSLTQALHVQGPARQSLGNREGLCLVEATKSLDKAGPLLWASAVNGTVFPDVTISVTSPYGEVGQQLLYKIVLTDAQIDNITTTVAEENKERVRLSSPSVQLTYYIPSPSGGSSGVVTTTLSCP